MPAIEIGQQNEPCKALVTFLVSPAAAKVFRSQGFEPGLTYAAFTPVRSASGRSNVSADSGTGRLKR